jgi:hypothetical protein
VRANEELESELTENRDRGALAAPLALRLKPASWKDMTLLALVKRETEHASACGAAMLESMKRHRAPVTQQKNKEQRRSRPRTRKNTPGGGASGEADPNSTQVKIRHKATLAEEI